MYRIDLREKSRNPEATVAPEETNILGGALSPNGESAHPRLGCPGGGPARPCHRSCPRPLRHAGRHPQRSPDSFAAAAWTAAFTPGGDNAVFGTAEGHLQVVTVDLPALAARACALAPTAPVSSSVLTGANLRAAQDACR